MTVLHKTLLLTLLFLVTINYSQTLFWKELTPNNSGYPSRYNKSIAFKGDSLLVPSNKLTIFEISKGNWNTLWFDSPVGSIISVDNKMSVWYMDKGWPNEVRLVEYNWNMPVSYSYPRVKGGEHLRGFEIDKKNNKWIISEDEGVYKFNEGVWTKYDTTNSNIFSNTCSGLFINNAKNEIWVITHKYYSTSDIAFSIFNGLEWKNIIFKNIGFISGANGGYIGIPNIVFDQDGNAWIKYLDPYNFVYDIYFYNGITFRPISNPYSTGKNYGAIGIDRYNNKWFTYHYNNQQYVLKYNDNTWEKYPISFSEGNKIWFDKYDQKWFMNDYGLVVFKENGLISDVKENNYLSLKYDLEQNHPNPFNPTTTITYEIPRSSFIILEIYDVLGRKISTLVNEEKTIGKHTVQLNADKLSSGVYLYTLRTNNIVQTKKMILIR